MVCLKLPKCSLSPLFTGILIKPPFCRNISQSREFTGVLGKPLVYRGTHPTGDPVFTGMRIKPPYSLIPIDASFRFRDQHVYEKSYTTVLKAYYIGLMGHFQEEKVENLRETTGNYIPFLWDSENFTDYR